METNYLLANLVEKWLKEEFGGHYYLNEIPATNDCRIVCVCENSSWGIITSNSLIGADPDPDIFFWPRGFITQASDPEFFNMLRKVLRCSKTIKSECSKP